MNVLNTSTEPVAIDCVIIDWDHVQLPSTGPALHPAAEPAARP